MNKIIPTTKEITERILPIWKDEVKKNKYDYIFKDIQKCNSLDDKIYQKRIEELN